MAITEKTIRASNQWVKITRDSNVRTFTFARGYSGATTAHDVTTLSFKWVPNWKDAIEHAEQKIATYA